MIQFSTFLPRQPQRGLDWTTSAVHFVQTRGRFLQRFSNPDRYDGIWWVTCFPFKGLVGRPLDALTQDERARIVEKIREMRSIDGRKPYDRNHNIEVFFRKEFEYPPYALDDNWDGHATARRQWAEHHFQHSGFKL